MKPTEILELSGAFQKNPNRRRPPTPKSEHPIGLPPKYFARDERACWTELLFNAAPGVLTAADRWIVETACLLMAKLRRRETLMGSELSALISLISKCGLSPVDRVRLVATYPAKKEQNPYSEFLN